MSEKSEIDWGYRKEEYYQLMHAMQTGVAATMGAETQPKHLRVGVNSALIESGALIQTLAEAGILDYEKFVDNKIAMIKGEIERYKSRIPGNVELI